MALTYLNLVNAVASQLGETELTSSNFSSSYGTFNMIKRAVNYAIQDVNRSVYEWPFQYSEATFTTVEDQAIYPSESDMKSIDWTTFYVEYNASEDIYPRPLEYISYDAWHKLYRADDLYEAAEDNSDVERIPNFVFPTPDNKIGLSPIPNSANLTIKYNYYKTENILSGETDTTNIPDQYEDVIVTGAMYYVYKFRDNLESASQEYRRFQSKLGEMRTLLVNKFDRVRDTRIINYYVNY